MIQYKVAVPFKIVNPNQANQMKSFLVLLAVSFIGAFLTKKIDTLLGIDLSNTYGAPGVIAHIAAVMLWGCAMFKIKFWREK
jgi:hypothetical protein